MSNWMMESVLNSPEGCFAFAKERGKRIPELEPKIMEDTSVAYAYLHHVIKERWPEAEPVIMEDPHWACLYAINILKGRWLEAESGIQKSARDAVHYAQRVLQCRWPEAEPFILIDPLSSVLYAKDLMGERWDKLEKRLLIKASEGKYEPINTTMSLDILTGEIKTDEHQFLPGIFGRLLDYARLVIKGPWPEAEPLLLKHPETAFFYARDVLQSRWEIAEESILNSRWESEYRKIFDV